MEDNLTSLRRILKILNETKKDHQKFIVAIRDTKTLSLIHNTEFDSAHDLDMARFHTIDYISAARKLADMVVDGKLEILEKE